jgi:hypothetical protein
MKKLMFGKFFRKESRCYGIMVLRKKGRYKGIRDVRIKGLRD